jgi:hypothetical protein
MTLVVEHAQISDPSNLYINLTPHCHINGTFVDALGGRGGSPTVLQSVPLIINTTSTFFFFLQSLAPTWSQMSTAKDTTSGHTTLWQVRDSCLYSAGEYSKHIQFMPNILKIKATTLSSRWLWEIQIILYSEHEICAKVLQTFPGFSWQWKLIQIWTGTNLSLFTPPSGAHKAEAPQKLYETFFHSSRDQLKRTQ